MGVGKKKVITCCGATYYHFRRVSKMRVELTRPIGHYPLKVARLPIPPPGHEVKTWSDRRDSDPRPRPWQGRALPTELLSQIKFQRPGATDGTRTRDLDLGKVALYQLSYCRIKKQPQILIAGTKVVLFFESAKFLVIFLMFLSIIFELAESEKLLLQFN